MIQNNRDFGPLRRGQITLANTLTIVADRSNRDAIEALLEGETNEDVANRLRRALKTAAKP